MYMFIYIIIIMIGAQAGGNRLQGAPAGRPRAGCGPG